MKHCIALFFLLIQMLTISSCSRDQCDDIVCLNGSTCINGVCLCTSGFSGTFCENSSNPCYNVVCLNGGNCASGTCICPPGFTGSNCQISADPCANLVCNNGGYCLDGVCICLPGYTGANCNTQITPIKIRISKITVTQFPPTDVGGAGWDLTSGADLLPELSTIGGVVLWASPSSATDADPSLDYLFVPSPVIEISNVTSQYVIKLFDYDSIDPNDFMGGLTFFPDQLIAGFPSTLLLDGGTGLTFIFDVTYVW